MGLDNESGRDKTEPQLSARRKRGGFCEVRRWDAGPGGTAEDLIFSDLQKKWMQEISVKK